ncbi:MAG: hypothetical protein AB1489_12160 [Acidobacteriota bacterium]
MKNQFQPGDEVTPIDRSDPWFGLRLEIVDIQQEIAMVGERDFVFVTDSKTIRMFKNFELQRWHNINQAKLAGNPMRGRGDRKEDWPEELEI